MTNLEIFAGIGIMLMESVIGRRFRSFDPHLAHSRAFFDRYFFWIIGATISLSIGIGIGLSQALHLPQFAPLFSAILGIALILLGYAIRWWAITTMGAAFSVVIRVENHQKVITSGPYRYVRHPSYTGGFIALLGLGVLCGYPAVLALLGLSLLTIYIVRIQREESFLVAELPGYTAYRAQTKKRLIPCLL